METKVSTANFFQLNCQQLSARAHNAAKKSRV